MEVRMTQKELKRLDVLIALNCPKQDSTLHSSLLCLETPLAQQKKEVLLSDSGYLKYPLESFPS